MKMKTEEIKTWYDLKKIVNEMTGAQLGMPVKIWSDGWSAKVTELDILEEIYINPSGEGVEPVSFYKDDEEFDITIEEVVYEKGQAILSAVKD